MGHRKMIGAPSLVPVLNISTSVRPHLLNTKDKIMKHNKTSTHKDIFSFIFFKKTWSQGRENGSPFETTPVHRYQELSKIMLRTLRRV